MIPRGSKVIINGGKKGTYEVLGVAEDGRYILGETWHGMIIRQFIYDGNGELFVADKDGKVVDND